MIEIGENIWGKRFEDWVSVWRSMRWKKIGNMTIFTKPTLNQSSILENFIDFPFFCLLPIENNGHRQGIKLIEFFRVGCFCHQIFGMSLNSMLQIGSIFLRNYLETAVEIFTQISENWDKFKNFTKKLINCNKSGEFLFYKYVRSFFSEIYF